VRGGAGHVDDRAAKARGLTMSASLPSATAVLERHIAGRVFPGAVVEVGNYAGARATLVAGHLGYDAASPRVSAETIYDLASLTKVLATTALAFEHLEARRMSLDDRIDRFPVRDLLEHCSGLPDHRPYYRELSGRAAYLTAISQEPLVYPPRSTSIYTDLGFILLGFAIEDAGHRPLDHQFDRWRDREIGSGREIRFTPPASWEARTAPTELDDAGRVIRGVVHDENAAALGGVAGHAGLFGTASAVGACARWWMTRTQFIQKSSVPGSSRALGWDTMLPTSSCGTKMSPRAFGHTGFTGTSLWIDPARGLYVAFLSNRVHPTRKGEGIQQARRELHDAIIDDLDQ